MPSIMDRHRTSAFGLRSNNFGQLSLKLTPPLFPIALLYGGRE
jgi:hypothetical protein